MCAVWGSTFFSVKLGVEGMAAAGLDPRAAPAAFVFLRFALAAALFPLCYPKVLRELGRGTLAGGAALAVPFSAGFLLQTGGLGATSATVSAFLTNLTVVLTPLLGRLFFQETLVPGHVAGAAVAFAGVWVLTDPRGGGFGLGEQLTALCALAFAFQIQMTPGITRRHSPEGVTFVMFVLAAAFSGALLGAMGVGPRALAAAVRGPHVAWTLLYTATVCSILALVIMNRWQREVTPTRAAVIYSLEPVFAAAFAAALAGERLEARHFAGGAIILAGNVVCEVFPRTRRA
jgi:drug/metabolite transporter (DMT)-like permease